MAIALRSKRITVNLSPADMPKEGSHFDLPIALALLAAIDVLPREDVARLVALRELLASAEVGAPVAAPGAQARGFAGHESARLNADAEGRLLEEVAEPGGEGRELLSRVAARMRLSARGYHRVLRVAWTTAGLDGSDHVRRPHVAEAVGYRLPLSRED